MIPLSPPVQPPPVQPSPVQAEIEQAVAGYYGDRLRRFGTVPQGVDWKDAASQTTRFVQLARLLEADPAGSVTDYGCGYGAFLEFLRDRGFTGDYLGLDLAAAMVEAGGRRSAELGLTGARFLAAPTPDAVSDYAVASGIFNVRLAFDDRTWLDYLSATLDNMNRHCRRGFAFNCLTRYSDPERMRSDLFYADPLVLFDYCKRNFARNVALLHDYDLWEFTVIVRKSAPETAQEGRS